MGAACLIDSKSKTLWLEDPAPEQARYGAGRGVKIKKPKIIATSAKPGEKRIDSRKLKVEIREAKAPYLILFGTGWGMTEELLARADAILEPINGEGGYNHLSVRSATAIILDRLLGK